MYSTVGLNKGLRAALFVDKSPSFNSRLRTYQFAIHLSDHCNHGLPQSVQLQTVMFWAGRVCSCIEENFTLEKEHLLECPLSEGRVYAGYRCGQECIPCKWSVQT